MYEVYCDDKLIYSPVLANEGYSILNAKVIKELNKAGSFEFTIPPNNLMYDKIQKLKPIIKVVSTEECSYDLKNGEKTSESTKTSIPKTVLYETATIDASTGKITLNNPLNINGSDSINIYNNYKSYPYFYGDLTDGTQDSKVYKFTSVSKSTSTGIVTITFYNYIYYSQETVKVSVLKDVFTGRILHDEKDFYKRKTVYCEGELAFLLDSVQRPYEFQGSPSDLFEQFLNNHNSQVDSFKQFTVGNVTVTDSNDYINRSNSGYSSTWSALNEKLVNTHGGYLMPRFENNKRYIDYLAEPGKTSSQVIRFGENLLDITEYVTAEDVFTVLIPLGADQQDEEGNSTGKLTIESVNDNKDYLESSSGISLFGRIVKVHEWEDVTEPSNLKTKGQTFLDNGISASVSLTLKAIDLHLVDVDTETFEVGDKIHVISEPHGIDTLFRCTKIELDLMNPDNSVYTFGVAFKALTSKNIEDTKKAYLIASQSVFDASKAMEEAKKAQQQASNAQNTANGAQYSVDNLDTSLNSEGVFKRLTNNGQIQGILMDEETGDIYINATYIKSGILTLGGADNVNGQLKILDADENVVLLGNKDGLELTGKIKATSGTLRSVSIIDGLNIKKDGDVNFADKQLIAVEVKTDPDYGNKYYVTLGDYSQRSYGLNIKGSTIKINGYSGLHFSSDNIIFEKPFDVPEFYISKEWTALTLKNNFENKGFEAKQLEYRKIGNHVYIRGAVKFPDEVAWDGSSIAVADLPTEIKPTNGNHYSINACAGSRIARVIATSSAISVEWIRKLSDGTTDTTSTGMWVSMNMDYWID